MDDIGPWRLSLGRGERVFLDLAELDNIYDVLALREMSEAEMKCIVLERLYTWHASNAEADDWLKPSSE